MRLRLLRSPPHPPPGETERQEVSVDATPEQPAGALPEDEALLADSVGLALLVVLDSLKPAERLAFVLHDCFAVPFEEIAPIAGRTPVAARMLASRARRRVRFEPALPDTPAAEQRRLVAAFLAAARHGDFAGLLALLDSDVVLRADAVAVEMAADRASSGAPELHAEMRDVDAVAQLFAGGVRAARLCLVDGLAGEVVAVGGGGPSPCSPSPRATAGCSASTSCPTPRPSVASNCNRSRAPRQPAPL